ncbi:MAG: aminoglycoside phosphotransferase family protein [Chloroflexi bacterium]|nr:aminoglycoside phosphotransferase family protein [Chloroflexota bacterium]
MIGDAVQPGDEDLVTENAALRQQVGGLQRRVAELEQRVAVLDDVTLLLLEAGPAVNDQRHPASVERTTFDVPAGAMASIASLPAEVSALEAVVPPGDGVSTRMLLQQRLDSGRGRVVEHLTLRSGRRVVVKARNDRALDREALFYQHLLPRAGDLVPAYVGSATIGGVHVLALDDIAGRPCNPSAPGDRERLMAALARFHRCFPGSSVAAILGPDATAELATEVTPDPIEQPELLSGYRDALTCLAAVLPVSVHRQADQRMETVVAAIAASPLLLDPGDVRPENILLGAGRTVLLDFENAAIRRSALALAAMLEHWPNPDDLLQRYLVNSTEAPGMVEAAVPAGQVWLTLREAATRVVSDNSVPIGIELVQRILKRSGY